MDDAHRERLAARLAALMAGRDFTVALDRPAWHRRAACRGMNPDAFFAERGVTVETARSVCARCPVTAECDAAGRAERFGVWAGTTSAQRRRRRARYLRRRRGGRHRSR